jgi:protein-tyrosine-phosphatase
VSSPDTKPAAAAADYTRIVDDLTYHYDGVFEREAVQRAVDQARAQLEPGARIPDFLPVLTERFDWGVADPAGQPIEVVRAIRDDIQARVTTLLGEILHQ